MCDSLRQAESLVAQAQANLDSRIDQLQIIAFGLPGFDEIMADALAGRSPAVRSEKGVNHMSNNKKPDERPEIKELLTRQLQLVSKESEEAHGETLAALSSAAADLAQAVAACSRALVYAFPGGSEATPKTHTLTMDEMPHHPFSL